MEVWLLASAAAALAGGALGFGMFRRSRARSRWESVLEAAQALLPGARISTSDAPELRAELEGRTVSLRIEDASAGADLATARAFVRLAPSAESLKLWIGWDVEPPEDWAHVPEASLGPTALDENLWARAEPTAVAQPAWEEVRWDLVDVRREAQAVSVHLGARAGHLELALDGIVASAALVERLAKSAVGAARALEGLERKS